MCGRNQKKDSLLKIMAITSTVVLSVLAIGTILYKLFSKYFKITFECDNNCDECLEGCCDEVDTEVVCDCDDESDACECECGCECETAETAE
ncbi:MAG: hypothetical protein IJY12_03595 [Clostridia bacterium]|nr:hypothetical protein [Clostridia bacterium]